MADQGPRSLLALDLYLYSTISPISRYRFSNSIQQFLIRLSSDGRASGSVPDGGAAADGCAAAASAAADGCAAAASARARAAARQRQGALPARNGLPSQLELRALKVERQEAMASELKFSAGIIT